MSLSMSFSYWIQWKYLVLADIQFDFEEFQFEIRVSTTSMPLRINARLVMIAEHLSRFSWIQTVLLRTTQQCLYRIAQQNKIKES